MASSAKTSNLDLSQFFVNDKLERSDYNTDMEKIDAFAGDVNSRTTDDLSEGSSNLFFTNPRVLAAIAPIFVGMKASFAASTAPTGWVAAQGQLLSRADHPLLWAHANASGNIVADGSWTAGKYSTGDGSTTFRMPDLRGYFDRNYDNRSSGGIDNGRSLGSIQQDQFQGHFHSEWSGYGNSGDYTSGTEYLRRTSANSGGFAMVGITGPITDGTNGTPRTGAETRPKNIALLACIFSGKFS